MRHETWLVLLGAMGVGGGVGNWSGQGRPAAAGAASTVQGCSATDGDTIRCGSERIRLLGIDAPELPAHCRAGRDCAPGDAVASTKSLRAAMSPEMAIARVGEDRYGRTLAMVNGARGDLSCWQLSRGRAIYRVEWDTGSRVARTCPRALR